MTVERYIQKEAERKIEKERETKEYTIETKRGFIV